MKKVISSSEYIFSQSVQGELHTTTEAKAELERKLNDLICQRSKDMAGKTASEWKQIEEDKKVRNWNVWYMQVLFIVHCIQQTHYTMYSKHCTCKCV